MANSRSRGHVGPGAARITNQYPWKRANNAIIRSTGGSLSSYGTFAHLHTASLPAEVASGGGAAPGRIVIAQLDPTDLVELKFYMGNLNNGIFTGRIWHGTAGRPPGGDDDELLIEPVCDITITAGAKACLSDSKLVPPRTVVGDSLFLVDTIAIGVGTDKTEEGSCTVYADAADAGGAILRWDHGGRSLVIVELLASTNGSIAGAWFRGK